MAQDPLFEKARQKAIRLLSLRGHSTRELQIKLEARGFEESLVKRVLSDLAGSRYLDDAAFARDWARHLTVHRHYGSRRIERSLLEKGVARDVIREVLAELRREHPERASLAALLRKKLGDRKVSDLDRKEKRRLAQSLMNKGYPAGLIYDALGHKEGRFDDGE